MSRFLPRVLALASALAMCALPLRAADEAPDTTTLKALFSSNDIPLSIRMKDLDAQWRRFSISGTTAGELQWQMMGQQAGVELGVHYTRGQTVNLGGETYLIAYRLPVQIDPRFWNWHGHGERPRARKPTDNTELSLSLLNLRTTGSLNGVRPFDGAKDMENTTQMNEASVRTLTQLGQGVMRYIRARGVLPMLRNPIPWDAGRAFYPYVGDERLYMHPSTQEMYRYNEILGGKKIKHISDTKNFALFFEATPSGDGTRGVLFLDGHVERVDAKRWETVMKASKLQADAQGNITNVRVRTTGGPTARVVEGWYLGVDPTTTLVPPRAEFPRVLSPSEATTVVVAPTPPRGF